MSPVRGVLVFVLSCILTGGLLYYFFLYDPYRPLHRIEHTSHFDLSDDGSAVSLLQAARSQLEVLAKKPEEDMIRFGEDTYPVWWLTATLKTFVDGFEHLAGPELARYLEGNFILYQAGGRQSEGHRRMLVTGYYEPVFAGSLTPEDTYRYPIYRLPTNLARQDGSQPAIGRYTDEGRFVPFWSRSEIETRGYLKGYELAYLKDPLDAFLLHVQGSGRLLLPDGTQRSVRFAGSNGLEYKSIGKLLVDEGVYTKEEVSVPAIRDYLTRHPHEQQRILHHNPRFIFFTWGDTLGPRGSSGARLTPGRSVAIDAKALPTGTIGFLRTRRPLIDTKKEITGWTTVNRFVFPQDSGAAIEGTGRIDIFWGHSPYAEVAASHMQEDGELFFLVKKGYPGRQNYDGNE